MKLIIVITLLSATLVTPQETATTDDVKIEHLHKEEECERRTGKGDKIQVNYIGTLTDGTQFKSNFDSEPFEFTLGSGLAIKGWDEGLLDMCVADRRKLTIPPSKGYGKEGSVTEGIPPDATLVYEIELVKIGGEEGDAIDEAEQQILDENPDGFFDELDLNKDSQITKEEFQQYIKRETEKDDQATSEGNLDEMADSIFAQEDKDKDGVITRAEFLATEEKPEKHDEL